MKHLSTWILLLAGAALADAQTSVPLMQYSFQGQADLQGNSWGTLTMRGSAAMPALLNAPFSGEEKRTNVQLLADGTRITQPIPTGAKVARDSQGRTRVERPLMATLPLPGRPARDPLMIVEINDPVEGYYYVLDPTKKVAYRVKYTPAAPRTVAPARPARQQGGVQVQGALITPGANSPALPEILVEPLGTRFIQGVQAEGERQTTVTPAGARGNDRPMTQITETWNATSLQLVMQLTSKGSTGESSFEFTNFSAVNPTPDLFRPPPGYDVRDQTEPFTVEFGNRPEGAAATSSRYSGQITAPATPGTQR
jgi:hypothetical protein